MDGVRGLVLCGRCDARQEVPLSYWYRCGMFPTPTAVWGDLVCNDGVTHGQMVSSREVSPCPTTGASQLISRSMDYVHTVFRCPMTVHIQCTEFATLHFRCARIYCSYRCGKGDYMSKCSWHHPPCASGIIWLNLCAWSLNKTLPPESDVHNMSLLCLLELCTPTVFSLSLWVVHLATPLYSYTDAIGDTAPLWRTHSLLTRQGEPGMGVQRPPPNRWYRSHLPHLEFDGTDLCVYHRVAELQFVAGTKSCPTLRERAKRLLAEHKRSCLHGQWQQRSV